MRLLLALACFTLLSLTGCSSWDSSYSDDRMFSSPENDVPRAPVVDLPPPILSIHSQEITRIIQEVSVNFKHKRHLHLDQAHTYYNEEGIHTIQLEYNTQDLLDPCDARKLIVDLTDTLLTELNQNMYLVPEFPNFAFFPFNFEIYISFESYYARYVDPFYIRYICMEDGTIIYYAADLYDNDKSCWHSRRESYYTSRDIVFYQRLAEDDYKKKHNFDLSLIFGDKRYIPKDEE